MNKLVVVILYLSICLGLNAQVYKTIKDLSAGKLKDSIVSKDFNKITNLVISGTIDSRDFKLLRDSLSSLAVLDLSDVSITEYTGAEGTIPNTYQYLSNAIPDYCFCNYNNKQGKKTLTTIILPSSILNIQRNAFAGCFNLSSINIPQSLNYIGNSAFVGCYNLQNLTIPSTVTYIGDLAFVNCGLSFTVDTNNPQYSSTDGVLFNKNQDTLIQYPVLKSGNYIIPTSVTYINQYAFNLCSKLTSISIPSSVLHIGDFAFFRCSSLALLKIPSSVKVIGTSTFAGCNGLIAVDSSNSNYSSLDGVLFSKNMDTLMNCPIAKTGNYDIPTTVKDINIFAFQDCDKLTSVSIPVSVTSIGRFAFYNCSSLSTLCSYSSTSVDLSFSDNVFTSINKTICKLLVPPGAKSNYQNANQWNTFLKIEELSLTVSSNTLHFAANDKNTINVNINSNTAWSIKSNQNWLTISTLSGNDSMLVAFTISPNINAISRYDTLTISAQGINEQKIIVIQDPIETTSYAAAHNEPIIVFPNPMTNGFWIKGVNSNVLIKISDLNGRILLTQKINTDSYILTNRFPSGVYNLQIQSNSQIMTRKIIKE